MFTFKFLLQFVSAIKIVFTCFGQSRLGIGTHQFLESFLASFGSSVGSIIFNISSVTAIGSRIQYHACLISLPKPYDGWDAAVN
jgi:hypothetical protein